jgi:probable selenium-dependent hydroxylase accessory protein YqeC
LVDVREGLGDKRPLLAGKERQQSKIVGFAGWFVDALHAQVGPVTVIAECDGAMGKSLKLPRGWEPVLPSATTVYIVVIGADCLGKPLGGDTVFQPESFGAMAGAGPGTELDVRLVARMMLAPESYVDRKPAGARCCIYVNKWETVAPATTGRHGASSEDPAMALALTLKGASGVERVVLGSTKLGCGNPIMVLS